MTFTSSAVRLGRGRGRRSIARLFTVVAAVMAVACTEKLEAGKACPLLCPEESVVLHDTVFDAVAFDSTVTGLPPIGTESYLLLTSQGDTLDTRVIVRYDTLPQTYKFGTADSTITHVDSAFLQAALLHIDTLHRPAAPVTVQLYDVDTTATDTVSSGLLPLFRPDRLIGSTTFAPESLKDTVRFAISNSVVLDRVTHGTRLRVGLRLVSTKSAGLAIASVQTGPAMTLMFRGALDTTAAVVSVAPVSHTPADQPFLEAPLSDYVIVAKGTATSPLFLSTGGVPSRRTYFRFTVPSSIVDSATIVRASLELTQLPRRGFHQSDTLTVWPVAVVAAPAVTDVFTALQFTSALGSFGLNPLKTTPGDSGIKAIEIVSLVRTWRGVSTTLNPRVIGLRGGEEWQSSGEIDFFSTLASAALRPRLHITFVPPTAYGLP